MSHAANVRIRPFEPQDRTALDACVHELQTHELQYEPRMKPANDIIHTYVDNQLAQCVEFDGAILVAEVDGAVIGYTTVFAAMPNDDPDEVDYTYAYVADLAVNHTHRGQGIGKSLLIAASNFALEHGATCLRISVLAENTGATSLYKHFGFSPRVIEMEKSVGG